MRNLIRKQGHEAASVWWVLLELLHEHGSGNVLIRDINDIARSCLTSASVITRVLTEMQTEYEGQSKLSFTSVGTDLRIEIKKFREYQDNLRHYKIPKRKQNGSKTVIEGEGEGEVDKQITTMQNGRPPTPAQLIVEIFAKNRGIDLSNKTLRGQFYKQQIRAATQLADIVAGDLALAESAILEIGAWLDLKVKENEKDNSQGIREWRNLQAILNNYATWKAEYDRDKRRIKNVNPKATAIS